MSTELGGKAIYLREVAERFTTNLLGNNKLMISSLEDIIKESADADDPEMVHALNGLMLAKRAERKALQRVQALSKER